MYGLYRAWFGSGVNAAAGGNNYPCLQDTFSPPDTVVRVGNEGEHQFVAHKGVLAAHSGYLKALLASAAATTTTSAISASCDGGSSVPASYSPSDPTCATVAAVTIGQSQRSQPVTSVSVSSVGGEAFAPLLNYMYTGRLDVTLDNVYSVLLATHLLHMPGALEQCRAALLRLRAPPSLPAPIPVPTSQTSTTTSPPGIVGGIFRPIPSRLLVGPPLCWPPTTPLYPPAAPAPSTIPMSHLSQIPPSMLMQPANINVVEASAKKKQEQCVHYSASEVSKSPQSSPTHARHKRSRLGCSRSRTPEIVSTVALPFVAAAAAAFTAFAVTSGTTNSTTRASSPRSRSISPAPSSVTHSPTMLLHRHHKPMTVSDCDVQLGERKASETSGDSCNDHQQRKSCTIVSIDDAPSRNRNNGSNNGDAISEHDRTHSSRRRSRSAMSGAKEANSSSTVFSVIYDIACCDGPVRFHRVLNENYSSTTMSYGSGAQTRGMQRNYQVENEDLSSENDENGGPAAAAAAVAAAAMAAAAAAAATVTATTARGSIARSPSDSSNDGNHGGNCYTCSYCKHTFKSQYCYKKHAKRHLLPTRLNDETSGDVDGTRREVARGNRREVRLLDLNVQYYPCKICGCKFPSYYFVHKHRKLCHASDEERQSAADVANVGGANASECDANASPARDAPSSEKTRDDSFSRYG